MWCLVLMLLVEVPGFAPITVLSRFATSEACGIERNRIGFEMAETYPYERDFVIECRGPVA